jgi:hypothetical protein
MWQNCSCWYLCSGMSTNCWSTSLRSAPTSEENRQRTKFVELVQTVMIQNFTKIYRLDRYWYSVKKQKYVEKDKLFWLCSSSVTHVNKGLLFVDFVCYCGKSHHFLPRFHSIAHPHFVMTFFFVWVEEMLACCSAQRTFTHFVKCFQRPLKSVLISRHLTSQNSEVHMTTETQPEKKCVVWNHELIFDSFKHKIKRKFVCQN